MPNKLFVGIGNKARQGKGIVADTIHAMFPLQTRVIAFADALKAHCRVAHGMTTKDAPLLQRVGVEMREQRPDFWCEILEHTAAEFQEPVILVPDLRFPNEAEFITSRNGLCVRVRRLLPSGEQFIAPDRDAQHISEVALDHYGGWFANIDATDGDLKTLRGDAQLLGHAIMAGLKAAIDAHSIVLAHA